MMGYQLPEDLYDEIIAYLWKNYAALKACALVSRSLVYLSHKRLFYAVCVHRDGIPTTSYLYLKAAGTTAALQRLLARSPHLREHIRSLHIIEEDGRNGWNRRAAERLSLPSLPNLMALGLEYNGTPPREDLPALLELLRSPTLRYVKVGCNVFGLLNPSLGPNVKHLVIQNGYASFHTLPFLPKILSPIRLETLCINKSASFVDLMRVLQEPNCRLGTSSLRMLTIDASYILGFSNDAHAKIWGVLQTCSATLEQFTLIPSETVSEALDEPMNTTTTDTVLHGDPINLAKLTSLKFFTIHLRSIRHSGRPLNSLRWLARLLKNSYATVASRCHLEEVTIEVKYLHTPTELEGGWHDLLNALLRDGFPRLKRLNISLVEDFGANTASAALSLLKDSPYIEKLALSQNLDLGAYARIFPFSSQPEVDVRWIKRVAF